MRRSDKDGEARVGALLCTDREKRHIAPPTSVAVERQGAGRRPRTVTEGHFLARMENRTIVRSHFSNQNAKKDEAAPRPHPHHFQNGSVSETGGGLPIFRLQNTSALFGTVNAGADIWLRSSAIFRACVKAKGRAAGKLERTVVFFIGSLLVSTPASLVLTV